MKKLLIVVLLSGCGTGRVLDPLNPEDLEFLTTETPLAVGEEGCASGGATLLSGIDLNQNGNLDDDEIQAVYHYCNEDALTEVLGDAVWVENALDAWLLRNVEVMDTLITDTKVLSVTLPKLRVLNDSLRSLGLPPNLPALEEAKYIHVYYVEEAKAVLELPSLRKAGMSISTSNLEEVILPKLEEADLLRVTSNPFLKRFIAPNFKPGKDIRNKEYFNFSSNPQLCQIQINDPVWDKNDCP